MLRKTDCNYAANSSDYPPVAVCFKDPVITEHFALLLEANGYQAERRLDMSGLAANCKIITEPYYLKDLQQDRLSNCLVVTNPSDSASISGAHTLIRPLDEDKIEAALHRLLANQI